MTVAERLEGYNTFDQDIVDTVHDVAARYAEAKGHRQFLAAYVLGDNVSETELKKAVRIDRMPKGGDRKAALVIHLAMGQPLDPNNLYQIGAIAAVNPDRWIIATANPSAPGYLAPKFTRDERKKISKGDFSPIIEPTLRYLEKEGAEQADQYGYSFGTELAAQAAAYDAFEVPSLTVIEPVTAVRRSLGKLGLDFMKSNSALNDYVKLSGAGFKSARKESLGLVGFSAGLMRLSNLAIANGLKRGGFQERMTDAMDTQPDMHTTIAWGTKSELASHQTLKSATDHLQAEFRKRVSTIVLPEQKHALANDVWLQAAIVAQSLRNASQR